MDIDTDKQDPRPATHASSPPLPSKSSGKKQQVARPALVTDDIMEEGEVLYQNMPELDPDIQAILDKEIPEDW